MPDAPEPTGVTIYRGTSNGSIRWAYAEVVGFASWSLDITPAGGTLTGVAARVDLYGIRTAAPAALVFQVDRPNRIRWRWPIVAVDVSGQTIRATVGPLA
jgi:hypothetical protein